MNNPFQEQLLKAGVVSKKRVNEINQQKKKKTKQQRQQKKIKPDQNAIRAKQRAEKKAQKDRELNQKRQLQIQQRAISKEIDTLIRDNKISRDESCEISYNFQHRNKINKLYVNEDMQKKIIAGNLGIARIEGRYELIPKETAEKIKSRNEKRVILLDDTVTNSEIDEEYADYEIPDDLMW